jgi:hypothetical protein
MRYFITVCMACCGVVTGGPIIFLLIKRRRSIKQIKCIGDDLLNKSIGDQIHGHVNLEY